MFFISIKSVLEANGSSAENSVAGSVPSSSQGANNLPNLLVADDDDMEVSFSVQARPWPFDYENYDTDHPVLMSFNEKFH